MHTGQQGAAAAPLDGRGTVREVRRQASGQPLLALRQQRHEGARLGATSAQPLLPSQRGAQHGQAQQLALRLHGINQPLQLSIQASQQGRQRALHLGAARCRRVRRRLRCACKPN